MTKRIAIIDYDMGNVGSVANMCKRVCEHEVVTTRDPEQINSSDLLILPGVGHFAKGVANLDAFGLREILNNRVRDEGVPILGICVGMQLLGRSSDEGGGAGLGWIDGECRRFDAKRMGGLKIPHMGWNYVDIIRDSVLVPTSRDDLRFYHVHSYHMVADEGQVIMRTTYGYPFSSGVRNGSIYGVQFHPEKSHFFGMELLGAFCAIGDPP